MVYKIGYIINIFLNNFLYRVFNMTIYKNFSKPNKLEILQRLIEESVTKGFDASIGIQYTHISPDKVEASLTVNNSLHQPAGIVHGGVLSAIVEAAGSVGGSAWLCEKEWDARFVGTSNTTDFIRPVSTGMLSILAVPIQRGKTIQLWDISIKDTHNKLIATGRLKGQNIISNKEQE